MKCESCKSHDDCANGSGLVWPCGAYEPKIITRADSFRAMSDEQMALEASNETYCPPVACNHGNCYECWLAYLQQPAEEGTP